MIKKKYVKSRDKSKITFEVAEYEIPGEVAVDSVHLVGEFNSWNPTATPMEYLKKGSFQVTLDLEPGREYQFRYLINGELWHNDSHADAYVQSEYGSDNCLIRAPEK